MTVQITSISPMGEARSHFGSAVHDGLLYVFGGGGGDFKSLDSVEVYDPAADSWNARSPMPTPRSGIAAATVGDRIYVMGGGFRRPDGTFDFKSTVDIYLPNEDRWQVGPSLLERHDAPAAIAVDGNVYLIAGHHPEATGGPLTDPAFDVCERLDAGADAWHLAAPLPTPRFSLVALPVAGQIWAIGGGALVGEQFENMAVVEVYNPTTDTWKAGPTTLPWPGAGLYAAVLGTTIWVAGGNDGNGISNRLSCYHVGHDRWDDCTPLPEPRVMGALVHLGDHLYLVGGRGGDDKTPTNTCFMIAPTTLI